MQRIHFFGCLCDADWGGLSTVPLRGESTNMG